MWCDKAQSDGVLPTTEWGSGMWPIETRYLREGARVKNASCALVVFCVVSMPAADKSRVSAVEPFFHSKSRGPERAELCAQFGHSGAVGCVAISNDKRLLLTPVGIDIRDDGFVVSRGDHGSAAVWNAATGKPACRFSRNNMDKLNSRRQRSGTSGRRVAGFLARRAIRRPPANRWINELPGSPRITRCIHLLRDPYHR
jgi:hypothetical protein